MPGDPLSQRASSFLLSIALSVVGMVYLANAEEVSFLSHLLHEDDQIGKR